MIATLYLPTLLEEINDEARRYFGLPDANLYLFNDDEIRRIFYSVTGCFTPDDFKRYIEERIRHRPEKDKPQYRKWFNDFFTLIEEHLIFNFEVRHLSQLHFRYNSSTGIVIFYVNQPQLPFPQPNHEPD